MTRLELVLVLVTFAAIVAGAIHERRVEERRRRAIRRAIRRATFSIHRQEIAFRGLMIAALEARRAIDEARISGLFDAHEEKTS